MLLLVVLVILVTYYFMFFGFVYFASVFLYCYVSYLLLPIGLDSLCAVLLCLCYSVDCLNYYVG